MSAAGVRRANAALSSGCKAHPAMASAASNRSNYGRNEMAEAFGYPAFVIGISWFVERPNTIAPPRSSPPIA